MKKGSVTDIPVFIGIIVGAAVVYLIVSSIFAAIDAKVDTIVGAEAAGAFHNLYNNTVSLLDELTVFAFFSIGIISLYLASLTRSTPILLGVGVVLVMLSVFIAPTFANVYTAIADSSGIDAEHSAMDGFFNNLPVIVLIFGAAMLLIMAYGGSGNA